MRHVTVEIEADANDESIGHDNDRRDDVQPGSPPVKPRASGFELEE